MSSFFPERANVFIDDHIVTPLLAKENEEADKITRTFKYDPESNLTNTTLETSLQSDYGAPDHPDVNYVKNFDDDAKPRSCCQLFKSVIMILLAVGNVTAWVLSFVYNPFGMSWNSVVVFVTGGICLITTLMMIVNERRILSYPTSEYTIVDHLNLSN
jgi:hypothetical protein